MKKKYTLYIQSFLFIDLIYLIMEMLIYNKKKIKN